MANVPTNTGAVEQPPITQTRRRRRTNTGSTRARTRNTGARGGLKQQTAFSDADMLRQAQYLDSLGFIASGVKIEAVAAALSWRG